MRRILACALLALSVWVGAPEAEAAPNCPNRPAGALTKADVAFNTSDGEGQLWEIYPGAGFISTPSGAPGSPTNASTSRLPAGSGTGGQQTVWPKPGNQQPLTNMYLCLVMQAAPNFVGVRVANKVFFVHANDFAYGTPSTNGFFGLKSFDTSNYPTSSVPFFMYFGHNSNTNVWDNSHTCSGDFGLECGPNFTATPIYPGTWYTIEVNIISASCTTCRNGTVEWWINGTLNGRRTNMNYGAGIMNQFQLNHTWDNAPGAIQCGPPTNPANPIGRYCVNDQTYYFDHLVIASTTAGGSLPPPPPPPPATLTPPTSIAMTSTGTTATVSWPPVSGITTYALRVHKAGTSYDPCESMVRCSPQSGTSFTFTAEYGATYDFWVHSVDLSGNLSTSVAGGGYTMPAAPVTPPPVTPPPPPPPPPGDLSAPSSVAMANVGTSATVSWPAVSGASQYRVLVHKAGTSTACLSLTICQTQVGTSVSFTAEYATAYDFTVYSVDGSGTVSPLFIFGTHTMPAAPVVPPPSSLLFETTIQWPASTMPDIDGYKVYRSIPCEAPSTYLKSVGVVTSTTDSVPVGTISVGYQVLAFDTDDHESEKTKKRCARFKTPSAAPDGLSITPR